jgi:hypothetical protein
MLFKSLGFSVSIAWLATTMATCAPSWSAAATTSQSTAARNRVAILRDTTQGIDASLAETVAKAFQRDGLTTEFLTLDAVCDPGKLSAEKYFLYVIPRAKGYPVAGDKALLGYLQAKGNLLVLGTPSFDNPFWKHGQEWVDTASIRQRIAQQQPGHLLFDFGKAGAGVDAGSLKPGVAEIVAGGAKGSSACLKLSCDLAKHATLIEKPAVLWDAAIRPDAITANDGLLCFWAKGDATTPQLVVELIDEQGASGFVRVKLSTGWTRYVLASTDFLPPEQAAAQWMSSRKTTSASEPARSFNFAKVKQIRWQWNRMTPMVFQGRHTAWIDQVGVGPNPLAVYGKPPVGHRPPIETIAPSYKLYPLSGVASLKTVDSQRVWDASQVKLPTPVVASACYTRPEGKGFACGYRWRWIPLARAYDRDGVDRGAAVWMTLFQASQQVKPEGFEDAAERLFPRGFGPDKYEHRALPLDGCVCAACAIDDAAALSEMAKAGMFADVARRIRGGLFLSRAGSQYFSYWPGEKVQLGAVAVNHGSQPAEVRVRVRVCPLNSRDITFQAEGTLAIGVGEYGRVAFDWTPRQFSADRYVVTTELLHDGKPIDLISHELGVLSAEKPAQDEFVTTRDGDFWLRGKKWYPVGFNYWPRYSIGLEVDDYTYHWLAPGFYDPEEVERDLAQMASMGANFLAIRANAQHDGRNLLDFLRRCRRYDMRVMLYLQSHIITDHPHYFQGLMMPYHFQEDVVADFLLATRLADNRAILAYDLIWEPAGWVFSGGRQRWDKDWARWIVDRYGSVANAEADWGMPVPRLDGEPTSPADKQFNQDGEWRVMVSAYRRFMDDLMSRHWNDTRRKLRHLDPNHLVSFRQGNLGSMDFTLTATPKHVDFFSMEGYNFAEGYPYTTQRSGADQAGFVNRYLHFLVKDKPFMWIEYGSNGWNSESMTLGEQELALQGRAIEAIQHEAFVNGANGFAPWWWPGGYRVTERTDFGLINPDGTARPSTLVWLKYAPLFQTPRAYPEADTWFTMDRDSHAGSHPYIASHEGADTYRQAAAEGKRLGVRTPGTGTTSVDTPLLAVGNRPYNGHNPPKYLDAEFNWFKIKVGDGPWTEVAQGKRIRVPKNVPITAAASVGNIQEATWLTPASAAGKPGAVYLASTGASRLTVKQPIAKDTAWQQDAEVGPEVRLSEGISSETQVELQMTAEGRAWFGEKLRFILVP